MIFFLSLSSCKWWEFNPNEVDKLISNSLKEPLFTLCTMPTCPHCRGLPEKLRRFAQESNYSNVIFTHIDCSKQHFCGRLGVRGVPQLTFLRGKNERFWKKIPGRSENDWARFLESELHPHLRQVFDLNTIVINHRKGFSGFHLSGGPLDTYQEIASEYGSSDISFTYSPTKESKLYVFKSPNCNMTFNVNSGNLRSIIEENLFNSFHYYNLNDFIEVKNNPIALVFTPELMTPQYDALSMFSELKCDSKYRLGWTHDSKIYNKIGTNQDEAPFLAAIARNGKCVRVSKQRTIDAYPILDQAVSGKGCKQNSRKLDPITTFAIFVVASCICAVAYFIYEVHSPIDKNK